LTYYYFAHNYDLTKNPDGLQNFGEYGFAEEWLEIIREMAEMQKKTIEKIIISPKEGIYNECKINYCHTNIPAVYIKRLSNSFIVSGSRNSFHET